MARTERDASCTYLPSAIQRVVFISPWIFVLNGRIQYPVTVVTPVILLPPLVFSRRPIMRRIAKNSERTMTIGWVPSLIAISLVATAAAARGEAIDTTIDRMPAKLETQYALSALPPQLRDAATVY